MENPIENGVAPIKGVKGEDLNQILQDNERERKIASYREHMTDAHLQNMLNYAENEKRNSLLGNTGFDELTDRSFYESNQTDIDYGQSRFDNQMFRGYIDNGMVQNNRAEQQAWYEKIGAGVTKMGVLAGTTFAESTAGLAYGIFAGFRDLRFASFYDNEFTQALDDINKWSEDKFKNYYSTEEENSPWYTNIFTANFIGDKLLKNMGFTIGAMAAGITAGGAISRIGGLSKIGKAAKIQQLENLTNLRHLDKVDDIAGQIAIRTRGLITADKAAQATKLAKEIQAITNRSKLVNLWTANALCATGESMIEAYHGIRDFVKYNTRVINDKIDNELKTAAAVYGYNSDEYREFAQKKEQEREDLILNLQDRADSAGNVILGLNFGILTFTNNLTIGKFVSNGFRTARLTNHFKQNKVNEIYTGALNDFQKNPYLFAKKVKNAARGKLIRSKEDKAILEMSYDDIIKRGIYREGWEEAPNVVKDVAKSIIKKGTAEGVYEEMGQAMATEVASDYQQHKVDDYYRNKINPEYTKDTADAMGSIARGFLNTYGSLNRWEEGFLGALTGAMGVPFFRRRINEKGESKLGFTLFAGNAVSEAIYENKNRAEASALAMEANKRIGDPKFQALYQHKITQSILQDEMDEAIIKNDAFEYKNAEQKAIYDDIELFDKIGRLNDYFSQLDYLAQNVSDKDLDSIVRNTTTVNENGDPVGPFAQYTAKNAEGKTIVNFANEDQRKEMRNQLVKNADKMKRIADLYKRNKLKVALQAGKPLTLDQLQELTWLITNVDLFKDRINSLGSEIDPYIEKLINVFKNDNTTLLTERDSLPDVERAAYSERINQILDRNNSIISALERFKREGKVGNIDYNDFSEFNKSTDEYDYTLDGLKKFLIEKKKWKQEDVDKLTADDFKSMLDMSRSSKANTIASSNFTEFVKNLFEGAKKDINLSSQEEKDLNEKIKDMERLSKLSDEFFKKWDEYTGDPSKINESHEEIEDEENEKEYQAKLKERINQTKEVSFGDLLSQLEGGFALTEEEVERAKGLTFEEKGEILDKIDDAAEILETLKEANKRIDENDDYTEEQKEQLKGLFRDAAENAKSIDQFYDSNYIRAHLDQIKEDLVKNFIDLDELRATFAENEGALNSASSEVNADNISSELISILNQIEDDRRQAQEELLTDQEAARYAGITLEEYRDLKEKINNGEEVGDDAIAKINDAQTKAAKARNVDYRAIRTSIPGDNRFNKQLNDLLDAKEAAARMPKTEDGRPAYYKSNTTEFVTSRTRKENNLGIGVYKTFPEMEREWKKKNPDYKGDPEKHEMIREFLESHGAFKALNKGLVKYGDRLKIVSFQSLNKKVGHIVPILVKVDKNGGYIVVADMISYLDNFDRFPNYKEFLTNVRAKVNSNRKDRSLKFNGTEYDSVNDIPLSEFEGEVIECNGSAIIKGDDNGFEIEATDNVYPEIKLSQEVIDKNNLVNAFNFKLKRFIGKRDDEYAYECVYNVLNQDGSVSEISESIKTDNEIISYSELSNKLNSSDSTFTNKKVETSQPNVKFNQEDMVDTGLTIGVSDVLLGMPKFTKPSDRHTLNEIAEKSGPFKLGVNANREAFIVDSKGVSATRTRTEMMVEIPKEPHNGQPYVLVGDENNGYMAVPIRMPKFKIEDIKSTHLGKEAKKVFDLIGDLKTRHSKVDFEDIEAAIKSVFNIGWCEFTINPTDEGAFTFSARIGNGSFGTEDVITLTGLDVTGNYDFARMFAEAFEAKGVGYQVNMSKMNSESEDDYIDGVPYNEAIGEIATANLDLENGFNLVNNMLMLNMMDAEGKEIPAGKVKERTRRKRRSGKITKLDEEGRKILQPFDVIDRLESLKAVTLKPSNEEGGDNENYVIFKKKHGRVHTFMGDFEVKGQQLSSEQKRKKEFAKDRATSTGTEADSVQRQTFETLRKLRADGRERLIPRTIDDVKKSDLFRSISFNEKIIAKEAAAYIVLQAVKTDQMLRDRHEVPFANNLVVHHDFGDGNAIAGEIDLITIDENTGEFRIYDFKTANLNKNQKKYIDKFKDHPSYLTASYGFQYKMQLSIYASIIMAHYPNMKLAKDRSLNIIPTVIEYGKGAQSKQVQKAIADDIIEMEFDKDIISEVFKKHKEGVQWEEEKKESTSKKKKNDYEDDDDSSNDSKSSESSTSSSNTKVKSKNKNAKSGGIKVVERNDVVVDTDELEGIFDSNGEQILTENGDTFSDKENDEDKEEEKTPAKKGPKEKKASDQDSSSGTQAVSSVKIEMHNAKDKDDFDKDDSIDEISSRVTGIPRLEDKLRKLSDNQILTIEELLKVNVAVARSILQKSLSQIETILDESKSEIEYNVSNEKDSDSTNAKNTQDNRHSEESMKTEVERVKKMLPQLSEEGAIEIVNQVKKIKDGDVEVFGQYVNGIIKLYKNALVGTTYHEAFHFVMDQLLTKEEKDELLAAAKKEYGDLSEDQLEEELAEGFKSYMIAKGDESVIDETESKVVRFFRRLYNYIRDFIKARDHIYNIYKNIETGKYTDRVANNKTQNSSPKLNLRDMERRKSLFKNLKEDVREKLESEGFTSEDWNQLTESEKEELLSCRGLIF